ncbi:hypothetical protein [Acinetobacter sp. CIP 51.11]|uniref:hypothetical protein n=1 Tax=Acinetobacter sp. CIP 51.11 TaxID=1144670 RepID=UPI0012DB4D9E|nr:hypothetical protein [Acinetobacter sp. CIP 51.11]
MTKNIEKKSPLSASPSGVYSNYCDIPMKGRNKTTPAMRLGLADAILPIDDILYYG